ncbi:unnamed protein product [Gongylonema pulchrum]|uniref:Tnp_DDE_dom domain-containing protein n=1 Tax=Gongylonema pulchrum TaxID=637853 RepID=A0A183DQU8_9BILA|nr:unnamed protein product [Gongylonema pulchrum]
MHQNRGSCIRDGQKAYLKSFFDRAIWKLAWGYRTLHFATGILYMPLNHRSVRKLFGFLKALEKLVQQQSL